jgi:hypothetical protein
VKAAALQAGLLAALLAASGAARAADPFTDAVTAAYAPYRQALFRTNAKAQAESEQAMAQARRAWQDVVDRFAAGAPPVPYAGDAGFRATLEAVARVYAESDTLVRAGRLADAHEALEQVRDLLAELRRRNGVVTFSDHMNAYHAEMEQVLQRGPALLGGEQPGLELMAHAGVLAYLAGQLETQAPPALRAAEGFATARAAVAASVAALRSAALGGDREAMRRALAGLKGPYSRLFLAFG